MTCREKDEIRIHRPVVLNLGKYAMLYISRMFDCFISNNTVKSINCLCLTKTNKKLLRLINKTEKRLEEELDVIKIV